MRTIWKIAVLELKSFFYSPIGWIILTIFTMYYGYMFVHYLSLAAGDQEAGWNIEGGATTYIFTQHYGADSEGILVALQNTLYLYIPILTMGLISREISSGSIKLLQSSPVKLYEIVWGKFLSMMVFGLILTGIFLLFVFIAGICIPNLDILRVFSGLLGIYLLFCSYSAIGLFISALTAYQIIAAISTLVVFAGLNYVGGLWQKIYILRDIANFLSLEDRVDQFLDGLISSRNIFYFLILTGFFLGLTMLKLQVSRTTGALRLLYGKYILLACCFVLSGYLSSLPASRFYLDLSANKSNTISRETQSIIGQLKHPLHVHAYVNILDETVLFGMPASWQTNDHFFEKYQRFMPDMDLTYTFYYDLPADTNFLNQYRGSLNLPAIARTNARNDGFDFKKVLTPAEIKNKVDLRKEENRFVWELQSGNKKSFLRMFNDMFAYPGETVVASALKRLSVAPPKIVFLEGNEERSIQTADEKNYRKITQQPDFRESLINKGFDVLSLSLDTVAKLPMDISALVISDPKLTMSSDALQKVDRYTNRGGTLLIACEPGHAHIVDPLLKNLGVKVIDGTLLQQNKELPPDAISPVTSQNISQFVPTLNNLSSDLSQLTLTGVCGLIYNEKGAFKTMPIAFSNKNISWNRPGVFDQIADTANYNETMGDRKASTAIALALTRTLNARQQRIFIIGDADFMSDAQMKNTKLGNPNSRFTLDLFSWLSNDESPINIDPPVIKDNILLVTYRQATQLNLIFLLLIPALLLTWATILLIRRKNK